MSKINEYPQATAINNNDLFVIDQQSGGDHATKSASVSQIAEKATAEVKEDIGNMSALTTTDKSSLVGAVNELTTYIPVWNNTASGAIATFDTSLALPLQGCTIAINAVQEGTGTPSPDNVRPITGFSSAKVSRTGKNLLQVNRNSETVSSIDFIVNSDGTITVAGIYSQVSIFVVSSAFLLKAGTYIVNGCPSGGSYSDYVMRIEEKSGSLIALDTGDGKQFTLNEDKKIWCRIYIYSQNGIGKTFKPMVRIASVTDDTFEPYTGETKTLELGQTVYGGSLDVTTGVLTVTHARVDLGSLTQWNKNTSFTNTLFVANVSDKKTNNSNCLCTNYVNGGIATGGTFLNNMQNNNFASDTSNGIYIRDDSKTSLSGEDFKTAMSGVYLVYELATPQTYQLTPTQISAIVGTNNVFTDTNGNTSVVYACSLKDYIEGQ